MNEIRFSVITITLNDFEGLLNTEASISAQACPCIQWIIVDGGSIDWTLAHLRGLSQPNCKWVSGPDKGIYDAMNKGLDLATGEYVIFMNSGDRFADGTVLDRVDTLLRQKKIRPDLLYGDAYEDDGTGRLLLKPARLPSTIRRGMFTHHQAMIYAREAIGDMRYDRRFRVAADYHFTSRVLAKKNPTLQACFPICIHKRAGFSEKNAKIGRRENIQVQREVLRIGYARCAYNYASFLVSSLVRTYMRGFYDRVRFRRRAAVA
jgi:putative colanic acid biosynthesis glycosyltransferase